MAFSPPAPQNDHVYNRYDRTFSRYGLEHGVYSEPVDEQEHSRQQQFEDLRRSVMGRTCVVPIRREGQGTRPMVLDCGTGCGAWVKSLLSDEKGLVHVTTVDIYLSQIQLDGANGEANRCKIGDVGAHIEQKRWNLNLPLQSAPGQDMLMPETFDIVHSRFLAEGIDFARWATYVNDLRWLTKKGGWIQIVELSPHVQSYNGRLSDESFLTTWWKNYSYAMTQMGKNVRIGRDLQRMLAEGGFDCVQERIYELPIGDWRSDFPFGRFSRKVFKNTMRSMSIVPLLGHAHLDAAEFECLLNGASEELDNDNFKLYYKLYLAYAQKPP